MARQLGLPLLFVWLVANAWGQISAPAITQTKTPIPSTTINGILRKITDDDIVVEANDKRIVTIALGITTKYYKATGAMIKAADLQPGDHMSIDATQDDQGHYRAKNVNQIKIGTASERAAASRPANGSADTPTSPRPIIHADEVNAGVTRIPDAPRAETKGGDPLIDNARKAAFSFTATLPNFVVKQFTTRSQTEAGHGSPTSWHAYDKVTADVVSEDGKESYKNILVNGKPPKYGVEKTGSWSTGEFSSVMLDVLSAGTRADFHNKRSTTIVNRAAYLYDFSVERKNSHWHIYSISDSYLPEYTGAIWIDKETARVLRVELSAKNLPGTFQLDKVESSIDYDYVPIGDSRFLLPVHSEALSCERATGGCSRNVIDFRNYRKFSADTSVTFDDSPNDSPDK
jgi:hypothetical protein